MTERTEKQKEKEGIWDGGAISPLSRPQRQLWLHASPNQQKVRSRLGLEHPQGLSCSGWAVQARGHLSRAGSMWRDSQA